MSIALALLLAAATAEPFVPSPLSNPGEWISPDDYPADALREDKTGTVTFALDVDATGRITSCWVTFSSGSPTLDARTCQLLTQRATFAPARDARGRKVAGQYRNRVVWQIPDGVVPLTSWSQTAQMVISGTGKLESCTAVSHGTVPDSDQDICKMFATEPEMLLMFRFTPGPASLPTTVQISMSLDGEEFPADYRADGFKVTNLVHASFEIDSDGKTSNCKVMESEGVLAIIPDPCARLLDRFTAEESAGTGTSPRKATILIASSVKQIAPTTP